VRDPVKTTDLGLSPPTEPVHEQGRLADAPPPIHDHELRTPFRPKGIQDAQLHLPIHKEWQDVWEVIFPHKLHVE
jgi:hypothetical protein